MRNSFVRKIFLLVFNLLVFDSHQMLRPFIALRTFFLPGEFPLQMLQPFAFLHFECQMLILGCSETCPASEVYSHNLVYFLFLLDFILIDIGRNINIVTIRKIKKLPVCYLVICIPINLIKSIDLETAFDSLKLYLISRQYLMCPTILLEVDTRKLRYELERTDLVSSFLPCRENP